MLKKNLHHFLSYLNSFFFIFFKLANFPLYETIFLFLRTHVFFFSFLLHIIRKIYFISSAIQFLLDRIEFAIRKVLFKREGEEEEEEETASEVCTLCELVYFANSNDHVSRRLR